MIDETSAHEDEVSLRELLRTLPKYKKFIFSFVAIPTLIALFNLLIFDKPAQLFKVSTDFDTSDH